MYSLDQDQSFLWPLSIMVLVWAYVTRRKYKCQICKEFARDTYPPVLQHIGEVHGFEPNFHVVCGIPWTQNKQCVQPHIPTMDHFDLMSIPSTGLPTCMM